MASFRGASIDGATSPTRRLGGDVCSPAADDVAKIVAVASPTHTLELIGGYERRRRRERGDQHQQLVEVDRVVFFEVAGDPAAGGATVAAAVAVAEQQEQRQRVR